MATLFLPRAIASMADGVEQVEIDAPRVIELLQELVRRYPALEDRLSEMAVAVDGDIYNDADYVRLRANSEVHLVPRIAGGSPPRPGWIRPATRSGNRPPGASVA